MTRTMTIIDALAEFTGRIRPEDIPDTVRHEAGRVLVDAIGCALSAHGSDAGRIGLEYGQILGAGASASTVIGSSERSSLHGAVFANSELVSALDNAPINQPGHVAPYVVPVALALGESGRRSGADVLTAVAVGLELTYRFSQAMDTNRQVVDGEAVLSQVMGFASSVFGTTAAGGLLLGQTVPVMRDALGIAAATSPVNSLRSWQMHAPNTSVKYGAGGAMALAGLHATHLAELGHRGDAMILDDTHFGYPRFIGTRRWEPSAIVDGLGEEWGFPSGTHFKPYPHCRVTHAVFDALIDVVSTHDLGPEEIESIVAYGEAWATGVPTYMNDVIERPYDGQFSFVHGMSVAAHRVPPGKDWQAPEVVNDPSVLALMKRIEWRAHEGWADAYSAHPSARPTRVEVTARGTRYHQERSYPHGSPSPDPSTRMDDDEVTAKFLHNAKGVLPADQAIALVEDFWGLEQAGDITDLMSRLAPR